MTKREEIMSLYQKFSILENWKYYSTMPIKNYEQAIQAPVQFIQQYFGYGGKADFLLESIYLYSSEGEERATHVVNTYFLGLYLQSELPFLQPTNILLNWDRYFLWAWFLCALYHDAFFDGKRVDTEEIEYGYCGENDRFLYSKATIENYFKKNANTKTSFDREKHYDHGILAASQLYKNYTKTLRFAVEFQGNDEQDFYTEKGIMLNDHLKMNYKTLDSLCKVAKVIACHNIYVCAAGEEEKYKSCHLSHLIPASKKFRKMPHAKNRLENDYEKLYYLLCLTDVLEPSKRGVSLQDIDFDICSDGQGYVIDISGKVEDDYTNPVKGLEDWLTGLRVSEEGRRIEIEMQQERPRQFIAYSIPWKNRSKVIERKRGHKEE